MGEAAEAILDGFVDEQTGEYVGDINMAIYGEEAPGFPVSYAPGPGHTRCPICDKKVKKAGLKDHLKAKHMPEY